MGNTLKVIKNKWYGRREVRLLILGLDAAGKTTLLYRVKLGEVVTTIPTIGFNVESIDYGKLTIVGWDVGGRDKSRALIRHYYQNTDALIYVVDSNDRERIGECRNEIHILRDEDELKDAVLLVMANKQDLPNALSIREITDELELHKIKDRKWHVQECCATTGEGVTEGFDWLHSELTGKEVKKAIVKPVAETMESAHKTPGLFSSFYNSLSKYLPSEQ